MKNGFLWKGRHSSDFGLICSTIPGFDIPEKRIEKEIIPGRSGYLTIDQEAYESIVKSVTFHVVDNVNVDVLKSWLIGMDRVTFSNQPDRYFHAQVISKIDLSEILPVLKKGIVQFDCQPFGYLYSGLNTQVMTQQGDIHNIGTYKSEPYIKIFGCGDIVFRVNGSPLSISGISDYVEIDKELDAIFKGTLSMEGNSSGDTPFFDVGKNKIEWTGNITRVEITPRWRCL